MSQTPTVFDLDQEAWKSIKAAAYKATWMPPEYTMNDWVADVVYFLSDEGHTKLEKALS